MMRFTYSYSGLAAAMFFCASAAQPDPYKPQTVEFDLVFPRNNTYALIDHFPFLWGLRNAHNAWTMGMMFSWELQRIDLRDEWHVEQGVFPNPSYNGYPYTSSGVPAPSNPYFLYYFPDSFSKFTEGQWKLSWKFGFHVTCTNETDLEGYGHFKHQRPKELIFQIDRWEGETIDLLSLSNNTCDDQSTAFHIVDWTRSLFTSIDNCPILSETAPKLQPCALKFNESLIEEMEIGAESGCSSSTVNQFQNWCKKSQASHGGGQGLHAIFSLLLLYVLL